MSWPLRRSNTTRRPGISPTAENNWVIKGSGTSATASRTPTPGTEICRTTSNTQSPVTGIAHRSGDDRGTAAGSAIQAEQVDRKIPVPGIGASGRPYLTVGTQQDDVAEREGLEVQPAEQAPGGLGIDGLAVAGDRRKQRRQAGQRAVDLEQLVVDDALDDQRGVLQGCVRGTQRGLPGPLQQEPRPTDQGDENEAEAERDGRTDETPSGHAGGCRGRLSRNGRLPPFGLAPTAVPRKHQGKSPNAARTLSNQLPTATQGWAVVAGPTTGSASPRTSATRLSVSLGNKSAEATCTDEPSAAAMTGRRFFARAVAVARHCTDNDLRRFHLADVPMSPLRAVFAPRSDQARSCITLIGL